MQLALFKYNSYHKIIIGGLIILWAVFHFWARNPENKFSNGQNKRVGTVENGKNEGVWTWYYPSGQKRVQGSFVAGKREGTWTTWNEAGDIIQKCEYHNDKLNGLLITFSDQGYEVSRVQYVNDVKVN